MTNSAAVPALDPGLDSSLLIRFQAIAEETRLRIVQTLAEGERCVCEIQEELDCSQSRLSFHLRKLREAGIVSHRRDGRWVHYSLVPEALAEMRAFLAAIEPEFSVRAPGGESGPPRDPECCR